MTDTKQGCSDFLLVVTTLGVAIFALMGIAAACHWLDSVIPLS